MHITAVCPTCQTSYQVQPSLRGQSIRCPNPACRRIFAVPADLRVTENAASQLRPPAGPQPDSGQRSGSVGDMVPILPAEPVAPAEPPARPGDGDWWQAPPPVRETPARPPAASPPPVVAPVTPTPADAPWWREAPPPVRQPQTPAAPPAPATPRHRPPAAEAISTTPAHPTKERPTRAAETQPMPALPTLPIAVPEPPRELPPGMWEPPPVRRGAEAEAVEEAPQEHAPAVSKRHAWRLVFLLAFGVLGVLGGGGVLVYFAVHKSEETRFAEAKADYEQGKYGSGASQFGELAARFPTSEHAAEYRFLQEWAALCGTLADADADADLAGDAGKFERFLKEHKKDPLMAPYARDAGKMLLKLSKTFAERNANPRDDKPLAVAASIEQLRAAVRALGTDALPQSEAAPIDADLAAVRAAVARWRQRQEVLAQLKQQPNEAPFDAIKRGRLVLQRMEQAQPGFSQDAEMRTAMNSLYDEHRKSVAYKASERKPDDKPARDDDNEEEDRTLLFVPLLPTAAPGSAPDNDPIKLALARGVLYALKQSNGEVKWATRVGVDTTALPLNVPATAASPERWLVLSADAQTLIARNDKGDHLWEYVVGQPVLGRPIVIDQRAYLAAYDGWVHEIELSEGKLLGRYPLGQRLTCGGAREGDSKRIYFPADDSCIYVLDVGEQRCVHILYDGHPSGSLRSEPIIVPPENPNAPGYLILNQASGLDRMRLQVFELPLQDRHAAPLALKPPAELDGWTWFKPYQDSEKLVVLSDAGFLGLFGIRQVGNSDQALFPLLRPGGLDLSPFLGVTRNGGRERGRSQVVHVQDNYLWVLAYGRLQQIELLSKYTTGPLAVAGWDSPRVLGSPLHAPQRVEDPRSNRSTFFLVTQPLERQMCLATAVNDEGRTLWQRQLGLVCQGEPLTLTPPRGGSPVLLALDQSGALFSLDPTERPRRCWQSIAPALDDNPQLPPRIVPAPDGHSAYEIAAPGAGKNLIVRHIEWASDGRGLHVSQQEASLTAAAGGTMLTPAGAIALVGSQLIVPLAEGNLARLPLPIPDEQRFDTSGPDWRDRRAPRAAPGHVVSLGGDRFLVTDGAHGVTVWEWPAGNMTYKALPEGRDELSLKLESLIAAPPILLPAKAGLPPRVLIADAAGTLHLVTVAADGALQPARKWELKGAFTGAPFVRTLPDGGVRIGCILDHRQLVWLDPAKKEPLWSYRTEGETIVGQPQLIEDLLAIALQSGRYLGLDPATGAAKGPGYQLRASAAPAAAPVTFDPGQMFVPLSDGTALRLPVKFLRAPAKKSEE